MFNLDISKRYALAVSGGIDSMVMLHMFASLNPRPNFFVATINHNLRKEAAADCEFVQNYCNQLGVECKVFGLDVPAYCKTAKVSEETGARLLRLQVLQGLDADWVCTAHHADDNAETVLMHLIRGSGANGCEGIRRENGKFLRPMLQFCRNDLEQYAQTHNVPHVEDSTNSQTKYTRNFLRHNVLPLLRTINENATENIVRFAQNIAQDNAFLESLADISTVTFSETQAEIPVELLLQPKPVAYRVLRKVFAKLNIWYDVEETHYNALLALAANNGGKRQNLPFGLIAVNDYGKITIYKNTETSLCETFSLPFAEGTTQTPIGEVTVSTQPTENALRFDISKIPPTAVFRTMQKGDVFCKFGGGTKPLNKYLIDKKIPQRKRNKLLLLADGNNVLIVCGVEIANSVKTEENSPVRYIRTTNLL